MRHLGFIIPTLLVCAMLGGCREPIDTGPGNGTPVVEPLEVLIIDLEDSRLQHNDESFRVWDTERLHCATKYLIRRGYKEITPVWIARLTLDVDRTVEYTPYIVTRVEPDDWDAGLQNNEKTIYDLKLQVDVPLDDICRQSLGGKKLKLSKKWWPQKLAPVTLTSGRHELLLTVGAHTEHKPFLSIDGMVLVPKGKSFDYGNYLIHRGWRRMPE